MPIFPIKGHMIAISGKSRIARVPLLVPARNLAGPAKGAVCRQLGPRQHLGESESTEGPLVGLEVSGGRLCSDMYEFRLAISERKHCLCSLNKTKVMKIHEVNCNLSQVSRLIYANLS